ncbi:MAG: methylated-DNA--[protein]-cysteine S-methyltransferase [Planctomycetaceae bacterium]|nr:methylated-DNA--[protein]-cysteine S-methyltransferase [Planctomycetaceae bacterium]
MASMAELRHYQSLEFALGESMYYSTQYQSPIGPLTLACHDGKLVGLWMEGQKYFGNTVPDRLVEKNDEPVLVASKLWLDAYFAGEEPAITQLPLAPIGGSFRQGVWKILCDIPYGQVTTYGDIAKRMATYMRTQSMSSQAVGGAVGHNPISIIIPCHRVVGAHGSLTGYAGGIGVKVTLLRLEGVDLSRFSIPKKGTAL